MEKQPEQSSIEMVCKHCGYTWPPRVPNPKYCPVCKRPTFKFSSAKQVKKLKQVEHLSPTGQHRVCIPHGELAMWELDGKDLCLKCLADITTTTDQLTYTDLQGKDYNPNSAEAKLSRQPSNQQ